MEQDKGVGNIRPHRVECNFRRAHFAEQIPDFRKLFAQDLLRLFLQVEGCFKTRAAAADKLERQITFIELGDEFGTKTREEPERCGKHQQHWHDNEPAETSTEIQ